MSRAHAAKSGLVLGALGVVFGDIGTSPLYAMHTVFSPQALHPVPLVASNVYGIISMVFWAITLVVTCKYVLLIMRADNGGEGGIMALLALIAEQVKRSPTRLAAALSLAGLIGASLFYGDSVITPAISVLSAVEGLEVVAPSLDHVVLPLTVIILIGLFALQRHGTHTVGKLFGPVMLVWFSVLALLGLREVLLEPGILRALLPSYGISFAAHHPLMAFLALSAVVLTVTGAEALYADMGHFGRPAITRAWLGLVFPALTLNYLGQGALLLRDPEAVTNPFFLLAPHWARIPLLLLATAATVIAAQAVITGAFSVTRQAVQLGYLPRLHIRHTSESVGQIYIPLVNWSLLIAVLLLVLAFGSSAALAGAYGIAVTACTAIDTLLFFWVVRHLWGRARWLSRLGCALFLAVDLAFVGACLTKLPDGGWVPVLMGAGVFVLLDTWQRGRRILTQRREAKEGPLREFIDEINLDLHERRPALRRVQGTSVFLHPSDCTTPLAMRANVEHNHILHSTAIIVWIQTEGVPHVPDSERLRVSDLGYSDDGIYHVLARFGFQDQPHLPSVLEQVEQLELESPLQLEGASFFVSKMTIRTTRAAGMPRWRKRIFVAMSRAASDPVEYFGLPYDQTVIMGSHIEL